MLKAPALAPLGRAAAKPALPVKKIRPFGMGLAAFLGVFSGFLPWICFPNLIVAALLLYVRLPLTVFALFFASTKVLSDRFLETLLTDWGMRFSHSGLGSSLLAWLQEIPLLCFLETANARVMGGLAFGIASGLLAGWCVHRIARARKKSLEGKGA